MQNAVTERSAQAAIKRAKGTAKGDNPATKYQGSVLKAVRMDGPTPRSVTSVSMGWYWAIQAGLLTPLTFARHRLSPLAAFTSGAYILRNGRR